MSLTPQEVHHVAHLARLSLTPDEEQAYARQLSSILAYVEKLRELDTTDVAPMAHALAACNVLRDDQAREGCGAEAALDRAPQRQGAFFRVPKVLEQGDA